MQWRASYQSEIEDFNTNEMKRKWLKNEVQEYERDIQNSKLQMNRCETEIKQIENKGESILRNFE